MRVNKIKDLENKIIKIHIGKYDHQFEVIKVVEKTINGIKYYQIVDCIGVFLQGTEKQVRNELHKFKEVDMSEFEIMEISQCRLF